MEYRRLGHTGIEISRVALGCGNFGGIGSAPAFFGRGENKEQAFALMDAARELGITLFDTADAYGGGRSERWIGEWRRKRGDEEIVLTTKVFYSVEGDPRDRGLAPERIRRQLAGSCERLGVSRVDLYLTHAPDPETPLGRTLEALDELRSAGTVRAIGLSNVDAAELETAVTYTRIDCVQNSYSLLDRAVERDVLPLCEQHGISFTAFGPLAGGWLAGRYRRNEAPPRDSRMATRPEGYRHLETDAVYEGLQALARVAAQRGVDTATLALAWLLADERVAAVIVGPRQPEHLVPARRALALALTPDEREEISALFS